MNQPISSAMIMITIMAMTRLLFAVLSPQSVFHVLHHGHVGSSSRSTGNPVLMRDA
jgi:hypothetical protein